MRPFFKVLVPVLLLAGAFGLVGLFWATRPEPEKSESPRHRLAVEVIGAQRLEPEVFLPVRGRVRALWTSEVASEVGGAVIEVHPEFRAGGVVRAGEVLVRIDPSDARTALAAAEAEYAGAAVELTQEEARAEQAKRDWEELGAAGEPSALTLRGPQLAQARSRLEAARSHQDQAQRNFARTEIRAPFDARIVGVATERGSVLAAGSPVATMHPVDRFEIALPVPVDQLDRIDLASRPQAVLGLDLTSGRREWTATVVRSVGEVDAATRSVDLIGEIVREDPAASLVEDPLAPGLFLEGRLQARSPGPRLRIPRAALVTEGSVFVVDGAGRLQRRQIVSDHRDADFVYVREGLGEGERVVVTTLQGAVPGMEVEVVPRAGERSGEEGGEEQGPEAQ